MHVRHQRIQVMFVYQGHRIKLKVTGAKIVKSHPPPPSITEAVQFYCSCSDGKSISVFMVCSLIQTDRQTAFDHFIHHELSYR